MHKKLYKAKKNWVVALVAGALLLVGGTTVKADSNFSATPVTSQLTFGWNGVNTANYPGASSYNSANIDTSILDANVNVNVTGNNNGNDPANSNVNRTTPSFSYNVSTNGHRLMNGEDVSVDYYFGSSSTSTRWGTNGADFDQTGSNTIAYAPTFRNSIYNDWQGVNGTVSNDRIEMGHANDSAMTHGTSPHNYSHLVKTATVNGNMVTNTVTVNAEYGAYQPGTWGITINPYWMVNGVNSVYATAAPYRNGNAFYYVIRDASGQPRWLEVLRPLNGTRMFTGHDLSNATGPLGGQQVSGNASTAPHSARSLYMMANEGTAAKIAYTESYYWIGDGVNNSQANVNAGCLDGYQLQAQNGQPVLRVSGWHVASTSADQSTGYLIIFDRTTGRELVRHRISSPVTRNDVAAIYRNVANSSRSGFDERIMIPGWALGHQLTVVARYTDDANGGEGHHTDLWLNKQISFNMNNNANLDNVQLTNGSVVVSGWHATNAAIGRNYHYIIAWDTSTGREIARQLVQDEQRDDVARAYPTVLNAGKSGFNASFALNQPAYANDQVQFISRWTSDARGNGNSVDYWFAPQRLFKDTGNYGNIDGYRLTNQGLQVSGWNATNAALGRGYHTIIVLDARTGRELGRRTVSLGQRSDVSRVFPGVLNAADSGFNTVIGFNPAMVTDPVQIISRWSATSDANENYVDHWFGPIQLLADQGNYGSLDKMSLDGNRIQITGWHASNQAFNKRYHWIILLDQTSGREVGRRLAISNTSRPDVASAYPKVSDAGNAGFNVVIDPRIAIHGDRLQVVSRWTNDPAGNSDGTDYWFAPRVLM